MKLKDHRDAIKAATDARNAYLRSRWPEGFGIRWRKNGRECFGAVVRHYYGARLQVRNVRTGRTYTIHDYDIVE